MVVAVSSESPFVSLKLGEEIKIENMQPTTTYRIDIRAKTEVGWGREKLEFPFTTESIRKFFLDSLRI